MSTFQTNVIRNGEWVLADVSLNDILKSQKANDSSDKETVPEPRPDQPPNVGILTKTVVESPVAHWMLPVRLRSAQHMDVAVIGDHYVQISELGRDGRLRNIVRKTDFGSRIRNAKVIGTPPESATDEEKDDVEVRIKMEDDEAMLGSGDGDGNSDDETMGGMGTRRSTGNATRRRLPPQQLLVVLESGDCVFLFIDSENSDNPEFVSTHYRPAGNRMVQPGFHTCVDPSSRYVAIACPENFFIVHELESFRKLNDTYAQNGTLKPIKDSRPRAVQGVIHKMEFLYPHTEDDYHIILLLIVISNGKSRMVTYEWEAGDNLAAVFREEKRGQPLPPQHQMPLLIVPLTLHSAFFAISVSHIGVCKDALNLPAEFDDFAMEVHETSRFHHGRGIPLWAAWTRPYRLPTYNTTRDSIYLAREDGVVMFLDINSDNILGASVEIGKFECNIGTAFCSLFDDFNDILIMGGDSGPGTIWQIRPRQPNMQLGKIPNWSPVVDLVTTDEFLTVNGLVGAKGKKIESRSHHPSKPYYSNPDRVFGTSGRGVTGAVTEFRYGLRADVGLEVDYPVPVKQSWIFATRTEEYDIEFQVLISLIDKSEAFYLSADLSQVGIHEEGATLYDLESRTLVAAQVSEDVIVQVTENCIVFSTPKTSARHPHTETFQNPQVTVIDACIFGDLVAIATLTAGVFEGHLLRLKPNRTIAKVETFGLPGDATCICLSSFLGSPHVIVGLMGNGSPSLLLHRIKEGENSKPVIVDPGSADFARFLQTQGSSLVNRSFESISSVALLPQHDNEAAIVFGTRAGDLVTLILGETGFFAANVERIGPSRVDLVIIDDVQLGKAVLATCNGRVSVHYGSGEKAATFRSSHTVWPFDAAALNKPAPHINSVTVLSGGLPGRQNKTQLVLSSTSNFMLAELHPQPGPVQRSLPLNGTPAKVLYSHTLGCLVVAIKDLENRTTLQFIDPDTGEDLSMPTDRNREATNFVSGLGKTGDQILSLGEWNYERQGDKWVFLLVCTKDGRFLIISTTRTTIDQQPKVQYWTRYKKTMQHSIYSVVSRGEDVFSCVGSSIYWDKLDPELKRLVTYGTFELNSCATSLRIVNHKLVAVTDDDGSVEIIDISEGSKPGEMKLYHGDSEQRSATHMIEIGSKIAGEELDTSLLLVCGRDSTASGLWVPWRQPGRDCSVVFEADLPASVRKLVRGRTRPSWQQARRDVQYGLVPSTPDEAEILGVCLDGSLQHFTLLSLPAWRLLRLVHDLALTSKKLFPFTYEANDDDDDYEETDPGTGDHTVMHIDGDMLQRCFDRRALEELFAKPSRAARLFAALERLDGGTLTAGFESLQVVANTEITEMVDGNGEGGAANGTHEPTLDERTRKCIKLLYSILEYYLQPAI